MRGIHRQHGAESRDEMVRAGDEARYHAPDAAYFRDELCSYLLTPQQVALGIQLRMAAGGHFEKPRGE